MTVGNVGSKGDHILIQERRAEESVYFGELFLEFFGQTKGSTDPPMLEKEKERGSTSWQPPALALSPLIFSQLVGEDFKAAPQALPLTETGVTDPLGKTIWSTNTILPEESGTPLHSEPIGYEQLEPPDPGIIEDYARPITRLTLDLDQSSLIMAEPNQVLMPHNPKDQVVTEIDTELNLKQQHWLPKTPTQTQIMPGARSKEDGDTQKPDRPTTLAQMLGRPMMPGKPWNEQPLGQPLVDQQPVGQPFARQSSLGAGPEAMDLPAPELESAPTEWELVAGQENPAQTDLERLPKTAQPERQAEARKEQPGNFKTVVQTDTDHVISEQPVQTRTRKTIVDVPDLRIPETKLRVRKDATDPVLSAHVEVPKSSGEVPGAEGKVGAILDFQDRESLFPKLVQRIQSLVLEERSEVRIQLKPDHLGELKIKLSMERGIMVAEFVVQNEAVREVIASQLGQLHTALQNQGAQLADVMVSIGFAHKDQEHETQSKSKQFGHQTHGRLQNISAENNNKTYLNRNIWNQVDIRV